jgi:hypothetical protein
MVQVLSNSRAVIPVTGAPTGNKLFTRIRELKTEGFGLWMPMATIKNNSLSKINLIFKPYLS